MHHTQLPFGHRIQHNDTKGRGTTNGDLEKAKTANSGTLSINKLRKPIRIKKRLGTTNPTVYTAHSILYEGILGADWCHNIVNTERQVHAITQDDNNHIWNENNTPQK
jgi:hypothetical protein